MESQIIPPRFDCSMTDYVRLYQIAYLFAYGSEIAKQLNQVMFVFQADKEVKDVLVH